MSKIFAQSNAEVFNQGAYTMSAAAAGRKHAITSAAANQFLHGEDAHDDSEPFTGS